MGDTSATGGATGVCPRVVTLAEEPDVARAMWAVGASIWPRFMMEDPVADRYYARVDSDFADTCLVALDGDEVVARAFFVPFTWAGDSLPDRGWDAIVERGVADHDAGRVPTAASALEIGVVPGHRRRGLSRLMLAAMREAVAGRGLADLVAPVRPSLKHRFPNEPMEEYLRRRTDDGLPFDPWLRVHVQAGATIVGVAHASMRIEGSLAQWRSWTDQDGEGAASPDRPSAWDAAATGRASEVVVPGALAPVVVDAAAGTGTYVEPNVWVHHRLG